MKRSGPKGVAKRRSNRGKRGQSIADHRKVQPFAKERERRIARGRQALKEAFEIGASLKADAETWKWVAEDKELEYL
jgi:hypothetical protein